MFSLRLENIVDITIIAYYHEIICFEQGVDIYTTSGTALSMT